MGYIARWLNIDTIKRINTLIAIGRNRSENLRSRFTRKASLTTAAIIDK